MFTFMQVLKCNLETLFEAQYQIYIIYRPMMIQIMYNNDFCFNLQNNGNERENNHP